MNAEKEWYENEGSIEELIGFLISAGFIKGENAEEIVNDIMESPEEYTEVWELFKHNITGEGINDTNGYHITEEDINTDQSFSLFRRYFSS